MNAVLWTVQIVLSLAFLVSGATKAFGPLEKLAEKMGWVDDFAPRVVRLIGVAEILGALGLVLPRALDVLPVLTPVAAAALALVMVAAAVVHVRRREIPMILPNLVLGGLAIFVSVARSSM